jgi:hypothetical protein
VHVARAVSTVLDVAVCLLLVGAAAATLLAAPAPVDPDARPEAATTTSTVATVTTTVPAADDRRAHDTVAGHLGRAAVTDVRIDGETLGRSGYPTAVANETASLTPDRVFVTATWEAYPGAPLAGNVSVGAEPPPDADVATRALTVDSGLRGPKRADSLPKLARSLAGSYVDWLFPPDRTYARLGDRRTADGVTARYEVAAGALDATVAPALADADVQAANDHLTEALADRLETDLRQRYETPGAAASNLRVDEVEVVVRRWEP